MQATRASPSRQPSILIFGATGFIGRHLCQELAVRRIAFRTVGREPIGNPAAAAAWAEEIRRSPAEFVIFLVGPALSGGSVEQMRRDHLDPLRRALTLIAEARRAPVFIHASSALVYGRRASRGLLAETDPPRPGGTYASVKLDCEACVAAATEADDIRGSSLRLFNVGGPGQRSGILFDLAQQIVEIRNGARSRFSLRSSGSVVDMTDVRDIAKAIGALLLVEGLPPAINVCSGRATTTADMVAAAETALGRNVGVSYEVVAAAEEALIGDPALIATLTGWRPVMPLARTLADAAVNWANEASGSNE